MVKENLPKAQEFMERAFANGSASDLTTAIMLFEEISGELASVEMQLRSLAGGLQLDVLIELLQSVHSVQEQRGYSTRPDLDQLADDIVTLRTIQGQLRNLVNAHYNWQNIDNRRRGVLKALSREEDGQLRPAWQLLAKSLRNICQGVNLEWARQLSEKVEALDNIMDKGTMDDKRSLFSEVNGLASEQFLLADKRLKAVTDQFQNITSSLSFALNSLQQ
jgi:hypothetical protein